MENPVSTPPLVVVLVILVEPLPRRATMCRGNRHRLFRKYAECGSRAEFILVAALACVRIGCSQQRSTSHHVRTSQSCRQCSDEPQRGALWSTTAMAETWAQ